MLKNKKNNNAIGIFDSGIGGLSVLFETRKIAPFANIIYIADTLYQPYGEKTKEEVINRSRAIIEKFIAMGVYRIIIACSTATAVALETLQQEYVNVSISGIITESFIAHTIQTSKTKNIGIIATQLTTKSKTFETVIKAKDNSFNIFSKATPKLVNLISEGIPDLQKLNEQIKEDIEPLITHNIDTLILGCTHFSLIKDIIADLYPSLHIISPPYFSAHEVSDSLNHNILTKGKDVFYSTYLPLEFADITKKVTANHINPTYIKINFTDRPILIK